MGEYHLIKTGILEGEFEGFNDDALFRMEDGTAWMQDEYRYWYYYAYCPRVSILKKGSRLFLKVNETAQVVPVRQIFGLVESQIDGDFRGWEGDTRYQLTNGQVWEQIEYKYEYKYSYMPTAYVYEGSAGAIMQVQGTHAKVRRIR